MKQSLTFTNRIHLPLTAQPVRHGVPWPQGTVQTDTPIVARDEKGNAVPVATRTLNRWPDGSVQWTLVDLSLDLEPSATRVISIETAEPDSSWERFSTATLENPVSAAEESNGITIGNGLIQFTVAKSAADSLLSRPERSGRASSKGSAALSAAELLGELDAVITDQSGTVYSAARDPNKKVWIEDANPLRTIVRVDGKHHSADGKTLLDYWVRFTVTANRADVKVTYHYRNLEAAEPGIVLKTMALELRPGVPAAAERSIVHVNRGRNYRTEPYRLREDFELCSSNTMDLATYPESHKGITGGGPGRVFIRQPQLLRDDPMAKPWFLRNVVDFKFQTSDNPETYTWSLIGLVSDRGSLVVAGGNMVGLHPKSIGVEGNRVRYSIWPEWAGPMDITQGEGRTLDLFIGLLAPNTSDQEIIRQYLSWELSGLYVNWGGQGSVQTTVDIDHVRQCGVFYVDKLPAYNPREHFAFERKLEAQWAPDGPVPANGHWHYGDNFYRWDIGANNEEMAGHVWFQEYLRTGRPNCLARGVAQAQHISDVDICFRSADPYQNGGMCSHGPRHNHSAAYPSHMWFTELLFAYALTGDEEFKKSAMRVCDNLVFWVNDKVGFGLLCADGRESGQPLINLSWTYQFAPEPRYLDAIWKIVRGSFMERVKKHGSLVYMKPREDFPLLRFASYGEWAAWEGLFYVWDLTRDKGLRDFILSQLDWRLKEELMATSGSFRNTDFNVAAYAYFLTGDKQWLDRVTRPFRAVFRAVNWPFGYIKAMFFIKLAFEHGIVKDDDVLIG